MQEASNLRSGQLQSRHEETLRNGFPWLRFEEPCEAQFRLAHNEMTANRARWVFIVALLLMLGFCVLDLVTLPLPVLKQTLALRLGLVVPILSIGWLAASRPYWRERFEPFIVVAALITGWVAIAIIRIGDAHFIAEGLERRMPYEGVLLITLYVYFLSGLRLRSAALTCLTLFFSFLALPLVAPLSPSDDGNLPLIYQATYLAVTNLIGLFGGYLVEHNTRYNYLSTSALNEMAMRDGLTSIFNRRYFEQQYERLWARARRRQHPLTVAMVDLDHFKDFNDLYGHADGDECLRRVAQAIAQLGRAPLDIIARYGSEEFVIVWTDADDVELETLGKSVLQAISGLAIPNAASRVKPYLTVSIGIAWGPVTETHALKEHIRVADQSLYQAKRDGKNRCVIKHVNGLAAGAS